MASFFIWFTSTKFEIPTSLDSSVLKQHIIHKNEISITVITHLLLKYSAVCFLTNTLSLCFANTRRFVISDIVIWSKKNNILVEKTVFTCSFMCIIKVYFARILFRLCILSNGCLKQKQVKHWRNHLSALLRKYLYKLKFVRKSDVFLKLVEKYNEYLRMI